MEKGKGKENDNDKVISVIRIRWPRRGPFPPRAGGERGEFFHEPRDPAVRRPAPAPVRLPHPAGARGGSRHGGGDGFSVQANEYYRQAVEELDFPMKPCRYELDLEPTDQDAGLLKQYLEQQLRPGEEVQLWSVWVPRYPEDGLSRYRGQWEELDREALTLLEGWNVCMTVER